MLLTLSLWDMVAGTPTSTLQSTVLDASSILCLPATLCCRPVTARHDPNFQNLSCNRSSSERVNAGYDYYYYCAVVLFLVVFVMSAYVFDR